MRLRFMWDGLYRVGSLTLVIQSIMGQEDELYSNHIPEVLDRCSATIGPSGRRVSLLDSDFGWYRKCSCATGMVFEPMRSHTYGVPT